MLGLVQLLKGRLKCMLWVQFELCTSGLIGEKLWVTPWLRTLTLSACLTKPGAESKMLMSLRILECSRRTAASAESPRLVKTL